MYSFVQAELSDIRAVLQKVSRSQIERGVSSEMVVRLFWRFRARYIEKDYQIRICTSQKQDVRLS